MAPLAREHLDRLRSLPLPVLELGAGAHPLEPGRFRVLLEGRLDVFAQERRAGDGAGDRAADRAGYRAADRPGPRHHLCSFAPGEVLLEFVLPGQGYQAIAVATGTTRLLEGRWTTPGLGGLRSALVEAGARSLIPGLAQSAEGTVALQTLLEAGACTRIQPGHRAGNAEAFILARVLAGEVYLMGRPELVMVSDDGLLPIARGIWIEAGPGGAELEALAPGEAAEALELAPGLQAMQGCLLSLILRRLQAEPDRERDHWARKAASETRRQGLALGALLRLLEPESAPPRPERSPGPLFDACAWVGAAAGIAFQAPPAWAQVDDAAPGALEAICRASRVRCRQVALAGPWWRRDAGPLLGYLGPERRPVALLPRAGGGYRWHDPAEPAPRPLTPAVAGALAPHAQRFYRPSPSGALGGLALTGLLWATVRRDLLRVLAMALGAAALGLGFPVAMGLMLGTVVPQGAPASVWALFTALAGVALGGALFDLARAQAMVAVEARADAELQAMMVDRLLSLPVPFFRAFTVGDLAYRVNTVSQCWRLVGGAVLTTLLGGMFSLLNLALMFHYHPGLAGVAVLVLAGVTLFNGAIIWLDVHQERVHAKDWRALEGLPFQLVGGVAKLRTAAAEARALAVFCEQFAAKEAMRVRRRQLALVARVFNDALPVLAAMALFAVAGRAGSLPGPAFLAFNMAFGTFFAAGAAVGNTLMGLLNVTYQMRRTDPILQTPLELDEYRRSPEPLTGLIQADHLYFRYTPDGPLALEDVSFRVNPGQFVAFVGASGSGKSTALRLLLGFEQAERGTILYDRQDLVTLDLTAVRSQIGCVIQSSRLVAGDLQANILGSSLLGPDEAWAAAEAVGLADEIRALPMGMRTQLSEGASSLSGGQRQRLLLARALVRNPRILLLDEATSALDSRSQELVGRSLERLNATRIVIAHRLSTIRNADRIYMVRDGRIVQTGRFQELIAQDGPFKALVSRQMA